MKLSLTWYNRPRKFNNGITWVRVRWGHKVGPGLWWSRRPFRVRLLVRNGD